jgi:hypothetical protein
MLEPGIERGKAEGRAEGKASVGARHGGTAVIQADEGKGGRARRGLGLRPIAQTKRTCGTLLQQYKCIFLIPSKNAKSRFAVKTQVGNHSRCDGGA